MKMVLMYFVAAVHGLPSSFPGAIAPQDMPVQKAEQTDQDAFVSALKMANSDDERAIIKALKVAIPQAAAGHVTESGNYKCTTDWQCWIWYMSWVSI